MYEIRQEERRSQGFRQQDGGDQYGRGEPMSRGFSDGDLGGTLVDKEWKEGHLEDYSSDVYTPSTETRQAHMTQHCILYDNNIFKYVTY